MFEEYLQLFDTLKAKKFSIDVRLARDTMVTTLNSDKFNPRVQAYLVGMHAEGEPFIDFAAEPDQISQIKKIINALYHAELALKDTEEVNLRDGNRKLRDIETLYRHTFHHTYMACSLATHLDVDLRELFGQELTLVTPLFLLFQNFAKSHGDDTHSALSQMDFNFISHKIGVIGGIVVDQFNPQGGEVDYEFLTQFSAVIPSYLDKLSGYIGRFSVNVSVYQPSIDKHKLEALQDDAFLLLSALDQARDTHLFLPLKTLHYIHIVRHTITLSMSILDQAGHLNESGQEAARSKLAELKYKVLPALFGLTDKIEEHVLLKPGYLSTPLMLHVSRLYQLLVDYTAKFVDFSKKGQELLTIEDAHFVAARLQYTYQRTADDFNALLEIEEIEKAADKFFLVINRPQHTNMQLIDLSGKMKALLIAQYKIIQPHMMALNLSLHNAIIADLTNAPSYMGWMMTNLDLVTPAQDRASITNLRFLQSTFSAYLAKIKASHLFHIDLNNDIIAAVSMNVDDLKLFPHHPSDDPFLINEATVLLVGARVMHSRYQQEPRPFTEVQAFDVAQLEEEMTLLERVAAENDRLMHLEPLTKEQAVCLHAFYQIKCAQLISAEQAYIDFYNMISVENIATLLATPDLKLKEKLCDLYRMFQPYLVSGLPLASDVRKIDRAVVEALSIHVSVLGPQLPADKVCAPILVLNEAIRACFAVAKKGLSERHAVFAGLVQRRIVEKSTEIVLVPELEHVARAHHVLKHQDYSDAISEFRESLYQLTSLFNSSVQAKLQRADKGIPFPELENMSHLLKQGSQVLGIKRLFNCLYHLEEIMVGLEALNDQSTEINYAYTVFKIGLHVREAVLLAQGVMSTPALVVMTAELRAKIQGAYDTLMRVSNHYIPAPLPGQVVDLSTGHSAALFYILNVLTVLPDHITALRDDQDLSSVGIRSLHEQTAKVTTDIERILANAGSYFKLFLEIPTMYKLFRDLKAKIAALSTTSHALVMDNLADINNNILTKMLLDADQWEDSLGLMPGTLTGPLKTMLDVFYQGLLEPIGLKSQRQIALVSNTSPFEQRLLAARKRTEDATLEQRKITEKRGVIESLQKRIQFFRSYAGDDAVLIEQLKALMVADFKNALPLLKEVKSLLIIDAPVSNSVSVALDALLNSTVEHASAFANIESVAVVSVDYFKGLHTSQQLVLDTVKEKVVYLQSVQAAQLDLNAQFRENYTKSSFKRQAAALASKQVGLIHCGREYMQKIHAHVQESEAQIVLDAKNEEDIDKKVGELLRAKIRHFEHENYKNFYHLERVMAAIDGLKQYVYQSNIAIQSQSSLFESAETLGKKSLKITEIENISSDQSLSIANRIDSMQKIVYRPMFKADILAQHSYDSFSYGWLKQWVASFVELLGLYTPEHKKCYKKLLSSVESPALDISQLATRYGLFSASSPGRAYELPVPEADMPQPALA